MHHTLVPLCIVRQSVEDGLGFLLVNPVLAQTKPTRLAVRSDDDQPHLSIDSKERLVHHHFASISQLDPTSHSCKDL